MITVDALLSRNPIMSSDYGPLRDALITGVYDQDFISGILARNMFMPQDLVIIKEMLQRSDVQDIIGHILGETTWKPLLKDDMLTLDLSPEKLTIGSEENLCNTELDECRKEAKLCNGRISELQNMLGISENNNRGLQQQIDDLQDLLERNRMAVEAGADPGVPDPGVPDINNRIRDIQRELDECRRREGAHHGDAELQRQLDQCREENMRLQYQLREREVADPVPEVGPNGNCDTHRKELAIAQERIAELERQAERQEADLKQCREELRNLRQKRRQAERAGDDDRVAELTAQIDQLRGERDDLRRERDQLRQDNERLRRAHSIDPAAEPKAAKNNCDVHRKNLAEAQERIAKLERELEMCNQELRQLRRKCAKVEENGDDDRVDRLEERIRQLEEERDNLTMERDQARTERDALQRQLDEARRTIDQLRARVDELQKELEQGQQRERGLREATEATNVANVADPGSNQEDANAELARQLADCLAENTSLNERLEETTQLLSKLRDNIRELQGDVEERDRAYEQALADLRRQIEQRDEEIRQLRAKAPDNDQITTLTRERDELRLQLNRLEEANQDSRRKLTQCRFRLIAYEMAVKARRSERVEEGEKKKKKGEERGRRKKRRASSTERTDKLRKAVAQARIAKRRASSPERGVLSAMNALLEDRVRRQRPIDPSQPFTRDAAIGRRRIKEQSTGNP